MNIQNQIDKILLDNNIELILSNDNKNRNNEINEGIKYVNSLNLTDEQKHFIYKKLNGMKFIFM